MIAAEENTSPHVIRIGERVNPCDGVLPFVIRFIGNLYKLVDIGKKKLRLPAALGYPYDVVSVIDKVNDLSFTTAVGLVKWGDNLIKQRKGFSRFKSVAKASTKIKSWLWILEISGFHYFYVSNIFKNRTSDI